MIGDNEKTDLKDSKPVILKKFFIWGVFLVFSSRLQTPQLLLTYYLMSCHARIATKHLSR